MPAREESLGRIGRSAALGAGVALGALAVGVAATACLGAVMARRVVTPARRPGYEALVHGVTREEGDGAAVVWLSGPDTALPGRYSLLFDDGAGHARVGEVVQRRGGRVGRRLLRVDRGTLSAGCRARVTGWWYDSPEDLGLPVERIEFETDLGPAEAWIVRPARWRRRAGRWAVHVHGRGALPEETLRGVAPFARAGVTSLVISYRNDPGAPVDRRGRYGLGAAEARDVEAAIAEAARRGASRVTLFGWSMGGTACLLAARGAHRDLIDGIVLDSPAIDWESLLLYQGGLNRLPRRASAAGVELLRRGIVRNGAPGGIDFGSLSPAGLARDLRVPVLVHASRADTFVPFHAAERFAAERPELVQLRLVDAGEHVKLWNADPEPWERSTRAFVGWLPRPAWRG